ncbi:acyl-CoA dehydrogenase family protein [Kutzneria kofuensis]|uniref:Alkylation response protein AidB-like acyl-CoA dehydrogenase n=1 Tax=Kutzneria kofuensis TaxID=103725 RepID=A0A7W9KS99_9PSEU|nr:acyl-CoA dehydrogenase family protein [Kutzneria kofuensis]MBB5897730.1 alkylation response protein AidB-like acyl-CoA dehydrogenase [Kutzneria kofuensis]
MTELVARARAIADEVLFPAAAEVDLAGVVPRGHFDLLAAEGFYGISVDDALGLPETVAILEAFAGGCLSTMFTWIQHLGLTRGIYASTNEPLRERYLDELAAGRLRGGVAYAAVIPPEPRMRARRVDGGYVFDGEAPFVSGWGIIDLLQLAGREGDTVISAVIDAVEAPGLTVRPLTLVAAQGTATVHLTLTDFFVPDERIYATVSHEEFIAGNAAFASRLNGCAPLGLAERAARLVEEAGQGAVADRLRKEIGDARDRLDGGLIDQASMPAARVAAAELAYRSAGAVVAATGSAAILAGQHGQRLVREATFLLVAAGRPEIKAGLLATFGKIS